MTYNPSTPSTSIGTISADSKRKCDFQQILTKVEIGVTSASSIDSKNKLKPVRNQETKYLPTKYPKKHKPTPKTRLPNAYVPADKNLLC